MQLLEELEGFELIEIDADNNSYELVCPGWITYVDTPVIMAAIRSAGSVDIALNVERTKDKDPFCVAITLRDGGYSFDFLAFELRNLLKANVLTIRQAIERRQLLSLV